MSLPGQNQTVEHGYHVSLRTSICSRGQAVSVRVPDSSGPSSSSSSHTFQHTSAVECAFVHFSGRSGDSTGEWDNAFVYNPGTSMYLSFTWPLSLDVCQNGQSTYLFLLQKCVAYAIESDRSVSSLLKEAKANMVALLMSIQGMLMPHFFFLAQIVQQQHNGHADETHWCNIKSSLIAAPSAHCMKINWSEGMQAA